MKESEKPELIEWDTMDVSPYRYSKLNWMNGIVANRDAVKTYSEIEAIEPVKVPGDKFKSLEGLYIMHRGERL